MKVYIVAREIEHEGSEFFGIFSIKEKAEEIAAKHKADVSEHILDEELLNIWF